MKRPLLPLLSLALLAPSAATQTLEAVRIASGMQWPVELVPIPDDPSRLALLEMNRGVRLIENGLLRPDRFLNMAPILPPSGQGILGLAFHPDYQSNGRFFVSYQDLNQDSWLVEYAVSADPSQADPSSAQVILGPFPQYEVIHNWNTLRFGPDGMLYLSTGDGGGANDPQNHGQDLSALYGKILRLDMDAPAPHIPTDNPFVGVPGAREEIWAYGFREPWRFSFDRQTGDLYLTDVGEAQVEEIDFQPASSTGGENYGWRCMEGTRCTGTGSCGCDDPAWTRPVHDYHHNTGRCAVIGGFVYRGAALPAMQGRYFYADFCDDRVRSFRLVGGSPTDMQDHTDELAPCGPGTIINILTFGEDLDGELYFTTSVQGQVFKIVPANQSVFRYCVGSANSAGEGARIGHVGTTSVAANDLLVNVRGSVPGQFGIFFYGDGQTQSPFGNGVRCVGGNTWRLNPAVQIDGIGQAERAIDNQDPPDAAGQIAPGATFYFQFWYRDPAAGGAAFNLSDGLRVDFCM